MFNSTLDLRSPQIDYDKLAKAMGMTNPRSAANAMVCIPIRLQ